MALNGTNMQRYSKGAILLHWLIAFALAGEIAIGFTMPPDASGFALFQLHKSIGITILLLTLLRLGWRLTHRQPPALERGFTGFLAKAVHVLLYAFMILAPLTGWMIVSSASIDVPTFLYGIVPWPHLPVPASINNTAEEAHEILAFIGLALFGLHVIGALRHHFLLKDGLLGRMAPGGKAMTGLLLGVAVVALGAAVFFGIGPREEPHDHSTDHGQEAGEHAHDEGEAALADEAVEGAEEAADHEHAPGEEHETAIGEEQTNAEEAQAATPEPAGPPPQWAIQPGGSLRFSVENAGYTLNGGFSDWGGNIAFDPDNPETADLAITVQLGSASLGDATQDGMLKGGDFFSVSSFPTATWRSTDVTALGGNRYRADGTLSLKGVSRPQAVAFALSGSGNRRSVTGNATIDRNAFGVGTGDSAADLAGSVALSFAFDATR